MGIHQAFISDTEHSLLSIRSGENQWISHGCRVLRTFRSDHLAIHSIATSISYWRLRQHNDQNPRLQFNLERVRMFSRVSDLCFARHSLLWTGERTEAEYFLVGFHWIRTPSPMRFNTHSSYWIETSVKWVHLRRSFAEARGNDDSSR